MNPLAGFSMPGLVITYSPVTLFLPALKLGYPGRKKPRSSVARLLACEIISIEDLTTRR